MLYILTHNDYDLTDIQGIFSTVEKAKSFASTVLGHQNLNWSEQSFIGTIWANTSGGTFVIRPAKLDPDKQD